MTQIDNILQIKIMFITIIFIFCLFIIIILFNRRNILFKTEDKGYFESFKIN